MKKNQYQPFVPEKIYIEKSVQHTAFAKKVIAKFPKIEQSVIPDANEILSISLLKKEKATALKTLLLAKQRGPFLRLCPGTQKHICCLYYNLDVAAGCDIDCSYCILQGYINNPVKTLYCNLDEMYDEVSEKLKIHQNQFYRIGTGELSDSLTFDHITELGADLVRFFKDKQNAIIELKSKSPQIQNILDIEHNKRTVVSWSLNASHITEQEESLAPDIDARLEAAKEVQKAGYRIGFHFDPMIHFDGWQEGYKETVDKIFRVIKPENIAWISLGALRYPPGLDDIIRENHPESPIVLGELLPGIDKKLRYFKPIRVEMFKKMYKWIKGHSDSVFVYLCMEKTDVWQKAFGWSPRNSAHLKTLLDDRVR